MAKERWGFFWKNIDGLGKFNRVALGVTLVFAGSLSRNNKIKSTLMGPGRTRLDNVRIPSLVLPEGYHAATYLKGEKAPSGCGGVLIG